jgi:hypothetical protein
VTFAKDILHQEGDRVDVPVIGGTSYMGKITVDSEGYQHRDEELSLASNWNKRYYQLVSEF